MKRHYFLSIKIECDAKPHNYILIWDGKKRSCKFEPQRCWNEMLCIIIWTQKLLLQIWTTEMLRCDAFVYLNAKTAPAVEIYRMLLYIYHLDIQTDCLIGLNKQRKRESGVTNRMVDCHWHVTDWRYLFELCGQFHLVTIAIVLYYCIARKTSNYYYY